MAGPMTTEVLSWSSGDDVADPVHALGYSRVAAGLRSMILGGDVQPGSWLRMQAMAERFGVSVQPVREALQQLQGEGLVEIHPNRGAQVRGLDRVRLRHIYEIRGALESLAARQFAEDASQSEIRALEAIQRAHDAANDRRDFDAARRANGAFHALVNGRGGNHEAVGLIRRYYELTGSLRDQSGVGDAYWTRVRTEHHALIDLFRRHDATGAAELGLLHVMRSYDDLLDDMDRQAALRRPA